MPSPYSYSSLSLFENCPQAYAHRYVWKTKVLDEDTSLDLYMTTGSVVHTALEWAHQQALDKKITNVEQAMEQLPLIWKTALAESPHPIPEESLAPFLEKSMANIKWYFLELFEKEKGATIAVEKKLMYPLNPRAKQWLLGFVDRVSQPHETKIVIHDYKTGSSKMGTKALSKDFQAMLYGAMAANHYKPLSEVELQWHYLSHEKTTTITLEPEAAREAISKAQRIANKLEAHKQVGLFPTNVGWQCGRCEYASVCPAQKK
ncbi:MAG: PD-(D/E)XK nuclease family protein [archaeon]